MLAFIPVAAVVALMARSTNWRDERVGPLLVTISAAVVVLYPLLGRFEAWATHGNPVDRYAMYLAPLVLVAMMLAPGRVGRRAAVLSAVALVFVLFAVPITNNYIEQPALYGTQKRLFELGFFDQHLRLALVLAALPVTVGGMLLLTRARGIAAATALIAGLMVMQLWTSQHAEIQLEERVASTTLAQPPDWVDRNSDGPVALLAVDKDEPLRRNTDLYTDFFNREVKYLFAAGAPGSGACDVRFGSHGVLRRQGGTCPPWPRDYVLVGGPTRVTFYGQRRVAATGDKQLVRLPAGAPRALSLVRSSEVVLHLDAPARIRLRFAHATKTYRLAPGDHRLRVRHVAALRSAVVSSAGRRTRIY